jgi:hypothetical protein
MPQIREQDHSTSLNHHPLKGCKYYIIKEYLCNEPYLLHVLYYL